MGVIISSDFRRSWQPMKAYFKASRVLGLIHRKISSRNAKDLLCLIYKTLVDLTSSVAHHFGHNQKKASSGKRPKMCYMNDSMIKDITTREIFWRYIKGCSYSHSSVKIINLVILNI